MRNKVQSALTKPDLVGIDMIRSSKCTRPHTKFFDPEYYLNGLTMKATEVFSKRYQDEVITLKKWSLENPLYSIKQCLELQETLTEKEIKLSPIFL